MAGESKPPSVPLVAGFPRPGIRVNDAYQAVWEAENGSEEQKQKLGHPSKLAHPWDPATCIDPELRWELWVWLDEVAEWINAEYAWEVAGGGFIPDCWPLHPHIVHELAVVADRRRLAGMAPTSDLLENWHRVVLPSFMERMKQRLKQSCDDDHQPWPARSRHTRHISEAASGRRLAAFEADLQALLREEDAHPTRRQFALLDGGDVIDPDTGEVL